MDDHGARSRLALALDVPSLDEAKRLIEQTSESVGVYKVGLELFTSVGPSAVKAVAEANAKCFLDLKLHDIPATMARAVGSARDMGVDYLTVHAAAGSEALTMASRESGTTMLLAVTVLTSLDAGSLAEVGFRAAPTAAAVHLARLAWDSGVRGFVSSAHECAALRADFGNDAFVATPGIRPAGGDRGDQKRVMTPSAAIAAGSDLLVVGRPIRDADEPRIAAAAMARDIGSALAR